MLKAVGVALGESPAALDVSAVHAAHADYVWKTLYRLGVDSDDLADQLQEVFVVVHRRSHSYDGSAKLRTWLYGICLRVACNYRRKAHRRRERPLVEELAEELPVGPECADPEQAAVRAQARAELRAILDGLDAEKRAVLVMFELEGLSCEQIADTIGVPVGTVYSRLFAARRKFEKALERRRLREARR